MKIPPNMTEAEVLSDIQFVCKKLAHKYTFGSYTKEDIEQEGFIEACKALEKYDGVRKLRNFLFIHLQHRYKNLIRNKSHRSDSPCKLCDKKTNGMTEHPDGNFCEKYKAWKERNKTKANLACHTSIDKCGENKYETDFLGKLTREELLNIIDSKLPANLRADYLKMFHSEVKVPKKRREEIIKTIKGFLSETEVSDIIVEGNDE
jgi:DNA-directed RNA polymerase specialized sigma24 family protein